MPELNACLILFAFVYGNEPEVWQHRRASLNSVRQHRRSWPLPLSFTSEIVQLPTCMLAMAIICEQRSLQISLLHRSGAESTTRKKRNVSR